MLFARRKTYVRRARSMSTEQNQHTRSRSVVLNEEGKRRHNLLVSALAGMSTRIIEDEQGRHAAFDPESARRLCLHAPRAIDYGPRAHRRKRSRADSRSGRIVLPKTKAFRDGP